ncbi:MAG: glycosyl hydrolase family 65 protein, partial [Chthoniobacterales bacterium]
WTWYTGAAGWIYRVWLEEVLGFRRRGDTFTINPVIPKDWSGFKMRYRYQHTVYHVAVENPNHLSHGVSLVELDGVTVPSKTIALRNDIESHQVRVVMGTETPHAEDDRQSVSQTTDVKAEEGNKSTGGKSQNRGEQNEHKPAEYTPIST